MIRDLLVRKTCENIVDRVWLRWNYFAVDKKSDTQPFLRGTEDYLAYPNGLILLLRRMTYESLRPQTYAGYSQQPVELFGIAPVGKEIKDLFSRHPEQGDYLTMVLLDLYSDQRYDVYWGADGKDMELNRWTSNGVFYVLLGSARDWGEIRRIGKSWLDKGEDCAKPALQVSFPRFPSFPTRSGGARPRNRWFSGAGPPPAAWFCLTIKRLSDGMRLLRRRRDHPRLSEPSGDFGRPRGQLPVASAVYS